MGTKLTEEEYGRLVTLAAEHGLTLGEWVREVLLGIAQGVQPAASRTEQALLAEVLALGTIVLNLVYDFASGEPLTPGGNANLATTVTYASSWAVTSLTGPNGANSTTTYDGYGRPQSTKIPDGAETAYTYAYAAMANQQTATLGTRWKRTTLEGFGRVTKVESGHDSATVSQVDAQYAPCACSPLGKVSRVPCDLVFGPSLSRRVRRAAQRPGRRSTRRYRRWCAARRVADSNRGPRRPPGGR